MFLTLSLFSFIFLLPCINIFHSRHAFPFPCLSLSFLFFSSLFLSLFLPWILSFYQCFFPVCFFSVKFLHFWLLQTIKQGKRCIFFNPCPCSLLSFFFLTLYFAFLCIYFVAFKCLYIYLFWYFYLHWFSCHREVSSSSSLLLVLFCYRVCNGIRVIFFYCCFYLIFKHTLAFPVWI